MTRRKRDNRARPDSPRAFKRFLVLGVLAAVALSIVLLVNRQHRVRDLALEDAGRKESNTFSTALITGRLEDSSPTNASPSLLDLEAGLAAQAAGAPAGANSGNTEDTHERANALLRAGDVQGAIRLYLRALEKNPESEELHFNLGIAYAQARENDSAEKHYREALRILPDYPEVHNNLGNLLLRVGRLQEAETHLAEAVNLMPEYPVAYNNLGIARERLKKRAEALEAFEQAVKHDTNYWQARFNLGNALLLGGQKERASAEFRETLRINPGYLPAKRALEKAGAQQDK